MASLVIGLNAVIVAVTEEVPRILTVRTSPTARETEEDPEAPEALPFGPLDPSGDATLELALRRWVRDQTGIELGYAEQLYTFADRDRRQSLAGPRVISVAYLALVKEGSLGPVSRAGWRNAYRLLPWEDWRRGRPASIESTVAPALRAWIERSASLAIRCSRSERAEITFGLEQGGWDEERVLERYELLYELGLVAERRRDLNQGGRPARPPDPSGAPAMGIPLALDHRRILATALGRLRAKIKYRPVVFELLPPSFTLFELQRVVEALAGVRLHKQNFRRLLARAGLVEPTGEIETRTGGRPARRYRFRRQVLLERPAPGVGLPSTGFQF